MGVRGPRGKGLQKDKDQEGEPGLQPLISKLAEAGATHTHQLPQQTCTGRENGNQGWAADFLK